MLIVHCLYAAMVLFSREKSATIITMLAAMVALLTATKLKPVVTSSLMRVKRAKMVIPEQAMVAMIHVTLSQMAPRRVLARKRLRFA